MSIFIWGFLTLRGENINSEFNRLCEAVTASVSDVIVGKKQMAELKKKYSENEIENELFDMYIEHRYDERKSLSTEKLIDIKNKM